MNTSLLKNQKMLSCASRLVKDDKVLTNAR